MDLASAKAAPGVLAIVTAENAGKLGKGDHNTAKLLGGPEIEHYHQAIAVVVAETFEQARAAAQLMRVDYARRRRARSTSRPARTAAASRARASAGQPEARSAISQSAFAAAPVQLDATYTTPDQAHAMMEPHASIAAWDGDKLTLWTSNQMIDWGTGDVAKTLGIPKENVRLDSPFIGGGFGGKLFLACRRVARRARRPRRRPAGQGGAAAAPDVQQHHASAGDDPAHPHRRDDGRQDHRHRPRELVRQSAGRQAGDRRRPDAAALRRRQPHDRDAAGDARPARRQCHARAGRGAGHDGAGNRHGRDGREARNSIRSSSASSTIPRSIRRSPSGRSRSGSLPNACASAPSVSAGTRAIRSRARSAMAVGWSAWAWRRRSATTC